MDQDGCDHADGKGRPFPFQCKCHRDERDPDRRSLLDPRKYKGIAARCKQQKNRQGIIDRIAVQERKITAHRQKRPEHQKILRGYAVQLQSIIDPVEQRI